MRANFCAFFGWAETESAVKATQARAARIRMVRWNMSVLRGEWAGCHGAGLESDVVWVQYFLIRNRGTARWMVGILSAGGRVCKGKWRKQFLPGKPG